jgi:hypothetical protein
MRRLRNGPQGCAMPECRASAARVIASTDPLLAPFCARHRDQAVTTRCQRQCSSAEAVAVMLTGVGQSGDGYRRRREIHALRRAAEAPAVAPPDAVEDVR